MVGALESWARMVWTSALEAESSGMSQVDDAKLVQKLHANAFDVLLAACGG